MFEPTDSVFRLPEIPPYAKLATSLKKHAPWRDFLNRTVGGPASNGEYDRSYNFTDLRDAVMHGRVLFPTYRRLQESLPHVQRIDQLLAHMDEYLRA